MIPVEKPGTPEELVHFGIKGMKWGVRKAFSPGRQAARLRKPTVEQVIARKIQGKPTNVTRADIRKEKIANRKEKNANRTSEGMSTKKKVAIGLGVAGGAALVIGGAYTAHKLNQSGKIALPFQNRSLSKIDNLIKEHGDIKISNRELGKILARDAKNMDRRAARNRAIERRLRNRAHQNWMKDARKRADWSVDWVKIFKEHNPGILD